MLIKFFPKGKGAGAGPVGYLVAERVLAYDSNRDLIRDADGQPLTVTRDPLPGVLRGDRVNAGVAWLAERRGHLQRAGREVERELELSEGRRRVAETELEAREREMDRGLTH